MTEQSYHNTKSIKPGLWFENLEPQIGEQFPNKTKKSSLDRGSRKSRGGARLPKMTRKQKTIAKKAP